jgi:hypothetical protein
MEDGQTLWSQLWWFLVAKSLILISFLTKTHTLKGQSHEKSCVFVPLNDTSVQIKVHQQFLNFKITGFKATIL